MKLKNIILSILIGVLIGLPFSLYIVKAQEQRIPDYMVLPSPTIEPYEIPITIEELDESVDIVEEVVSENVFIPLSSNMDIELQEYVFEITENTNISPFIIIAMCEHESNCNPKAISNDGSCLGIMQIQPKWHAETLRKLNITDLLDGKQCILTGVDIIENIAESNNDINYVLMCYNGGAQYANKKLKEGIVSDYAKSIIARAQELEAEYDLQ